MYARCPHCGASYTVSDTFAGKAARCRKCQQSFNMPSVAAPAVAAGKGQAAMPPPLPPTPKATTSASAPPQESAAIGESANKKWLIAAVAGVAVVVLVAGSFIVGKFFSRGDTPPPVAVASSIARPPAPESQPSIAAEHHEPVRAESTARPSPVVAPPISPVPVAAGEHHSDVPTPPAAPEHPEEPSGHGQLTAKTLHTLKDATVFVKVEAGPFSATGSGFVMQLDGDDAFIVTNHHVVDPNREFVQRSGPGRYRALRTSVPASIYVVFHSGAKGERVASAEVLASDSSRDLAILRARGVKDVAAAIDLSHKATLVETMPIFILGFPFGENLSLTKGNPAITVNKGSVSSIRDDEFGHTKVVQIDGALNPGNSGGPVVDEHGQLVGVAVATIRGSGIGLAIAPDEVSRMLLGRIGAVKLTTRNAASQTEIDVEIELIDPLSRIRSAGLHYITGHASERVQQNKDGHWPAMAGGQDLDCRIDGSKATGTLILPGPGQQNGAFQYQAVYVDGAGTTCYTGPAVHQLTAQAAIRARQRSPVAINLAPPVEFVPPHGLTGIASSGEALYAEGTVGEIQSKPVDIAVGPTKDCICWSRNGKSFFCLSQGGTVQRIGLASLAEEAKLDIDRSCTWLTESALGPIVTVTNPWQAWLLDETTLRKVAAVTIPTADRVVSSPSLYLAFAGGHTGDVSIIDVRSRRIVKQYRRQEIGPQAGFGLATVTPDGRYLLARGSLEQLVRYRINANSLRLEQSSTRLGFNSQRIDVSADGKYVCMPSSQGNVGASYATHIFAVGNLGHPKLTLGSGAYPRAVGFDQTAGLIYGQDFQHQLVIFSPAGIKLQESQLATTTGQVQQILVHPAGRKLLVLTADGLFLVDVPKA
jgi:predicted Zn finger-like uncharacterized protein